MKPETPRENEGKNILIECNGNSYQRIPIKTKLITSEDSIVEVAQTYAGNYLQEGDILFISEKAVACSQGRAIPMSEIKPRRLARFLVKFVYKSPHGIGLGIPETMEMALRECGTFRILFAAGCSAIGKLFRRRGWFYKIAGPTPFRPTTPMWCSVPKSRILWQKKLPKRLAMLALLWTSTILTASFSAHPTKRSTVICTAESCRTTPWVKTASKRPWASSAP